MNRYQKQMEALQKIMEDGDLLLKVFGDMEMAADAWCGRSIDSAIQDRLDAWIENEVTA